MINTYTTVFATHSSTATTRTLTTTSSTSGMPLLTLAAAAAAITNTRATAHILKALTSHAMRATIITINITTALTVEAVTSRSTHPAPMLTALKASKIEHLSTHASLATVKARTTETIGNQAIEAAGGSLAAAAGVGRAVGVTELSGGGAIVTSAVLRPTERGSRCCLRKSVTPHRELATFLLYSEYVSDVPRRACAFLTSCETPLAPRGWLGAEKRHWSGKIGCARRCYKRGQHVRVSYSHWHRSCTSQ